MLTGRDYAICVLGAIVATCVVFIIQDISLTYERLRVCRQNLSEIEDRQAIEDFVKQEFGGAP